MVCLLQISPPKPCMCFPSAPTCAICHMPLRRPVLYVVSQNCVLMRLHNFVLAALSFVIDVQAVAEQIAQERDAAEREAREKETRVLSLTREIDEMNEKVEELERGRRQLQAELDELVNNQGTADKNVSIECLRLLSDEK